MSEPRDAPEIPAVHAAGWFPLARETGVARYLVQWIGCLFIGWGHTAAMQQAGSAWGFTASIVALILPAAATTALLGEHSLRRSYRWLLTWAIPFTYPLMAQPLMALATAWCIHQFFFVERADRRDVAAARRSAHSRAPKRARRTSKVSS